jgi:hypothetical protein
MAKKDKVEPQTMTFQTREAITTTIPAPGETEAPQEDVNHADLQTSSADRGQD